MKRDAGLSYILHCQLQTLKATRFSKQGLQDLLGSLGGRRGGRDTICNYNDFEYLEALLITTHEPPRKSILPDSASAQNIPGSLLEYQENVA